MAKDAYYFSHDSNAKDDPKCVMLIEQLGLEGYGIFWVLIETLREQPNYKYPVCLIPALARRFNTTADKMKAVVSGYGLFVVDENDFFSLSLIERMKAIEAKREQARQAIQSRWNRQKQLPKPKNDTDEIRPYNGSNTDELQGKESKVKESKGKESKVEEDSSAADISKIQFVFEGEGFGTIGPTVLDDMNDLMDKHHVEPAMIIEALKEAKRSNATSWAFASSIIARALTKGITTLEQFQADQAEYKNKKAASKGQPVKKHTDVIDW